MSRNMLPFWIAARMPAMPTGSGRAVGGVMLTMGALKLPGRTSSAVARLPVWMAAMSLGWIGIGESCQFQKRVRSSFSAQLNRPSTASPNTPPEERGITSTLAWPSAMPRLAIQPRHS